MSTYRDPAGWQVELGAMRIPTSHLLVTSFIKEIFQLPTETFPHYDDETYVYVNGICVKKKDYIRNPDCLGYNTRSDEKGKTAEDLLNHALQPYLVELLEQGWKNFTKKYDGLSVRQVLVKAGLSKEALRMICILENVAAILDLSITEGIEIIYELAHDVKFYCIPNGNDHLSKSFLQALRDCSILYSAKVVKVKQAQEQVVVEYRNGVHVNHCSGDYVIMTTSPSAMACIEFHPPLNSEKQHSLRETKLDAATKIILAFSERFWEKEGILGGATITDLPSRNLYYLTGGPDYPGGIVMSYTWQDEANILMTRSDEELLKIVMDTLATIHGQHIRELFTGGVVKAWSLDPYTLGAFASTMPYHRLHHHDELERPAGRIWFSGEHISAPHAWIESAIKSALRTAVRLHNTMQNEDS